MQGTVLKILASRDEWLILSDDRQSIHGQFQIVTDLHYIFTVIILYQTALQNKPQLYLIAAMSENHVIGINNRLPWHLPDEWANFRRVTHGKAFITGSKSYTAPDALHSTYRNIVLTKHPTEQADSGVEYATDLDQALSLLREENEVFVLGGASVFVQTLPLADKLFLTIVHAHIDGDAVFPAISLADWELVSSNYHGSDDDHAYSFSMNVYERKGNGSDQASDGQPIL